MQIEFSVAEEFRSELAAFSNFLLPLKCILILNSLFPHASPPPNTIFAFFSTPYFVFQHGSSLLIKIKQRHPRDIIDRIPPCVSNTTILERKTVPHNWLGCCVFDEPLNCFRKFCSQFSVLCLQGLGKGHPDGSLSAEMYRVGWLDDMASTSRDFGSHWDIEVGLVVLFLWSYLQGTISITYFDFDY